MIQLAFKYGLIFLMILIVFSTIGHFLYCLFLPKISRNYLRLFVKLGLGIVASTALYAIFQTKGVTILSLFLILMALMIREGALRFKIPKSKDLLKLEELKFYALNVLIPAVLFFIWECAFMFKSGSFNLISPPSDYHHYSEISTALSITGQENIFGYKNSIMDIFKGTTPYHYMELWINNMICSTFGISNIVGMMILSFPLLILWAYTGICALIENYKTLDFKLKLLAIVMLGVTGIYLGFYDGIPYVSSGKILCVNPLDTYYRKYIIYYPFVIGFWLLFENKKWALSFLLLNALLIVSAGVLPGLVSGVILYAILGRIFRLHSNKILIKISAYTLFMAGVWALFYYLTSNKSIAINNLDDLMSISTWKESLTYRTILNIYVLTSIQYLVNFLPIILLLIFIKKPSASIYLKPSKMPKHMFFILVFFFCSLSCWAILHLTGNARQFFSNAFAVLFNCWLVIQLVKILVEYNKSTLIYLLFFVLAGYNIYLSYNNNFNSRVVEIEDEYINDFLNQYTQDAHSKVIFGGIIFSKEETNYITQRRDKAFHIYPLAHYTNLGKQKIDVHNLSVFDAPKLDDNTKEKRFKHLIEITPFYQFVTRQKMEGNFSSLAQSKVEFIKAYKLQFLVIRKGGEIPDQIDSYIKETITDSKSGDRVIFLKQQ